MPPDPSARPGSSSSAASPGSPTVPPLNIPRKPFYNLNAQAPSPTYASARPASPSANNSNTSLPNFSRPSGQLLPPNEISTRKSSPSSDVHRHRPRQHSQGFFEPTLPTATVHADQQQQQQQQQQPHVRVTPPLSASRIAAQTAMQHQTAGQQQQSMRHRSSTIPPQDNHGSGRKVTSPPPAPPLPSTTKGQTGTPAGGGAQGLSYQNGTVGGRAAAAATAANLAFPRNAALAHQSPAVDHGQQPQQRQQQDSGSGHHKQKGEKSKMKLFSKPKHMVISRDKDKDSDKKEKDKPGPSPNKGPFPGPSGLSRIVNASTTSLNDSTTSSSSSMYNMSNSSAATVVPAERHSYEKEKDKDKDKDRDKEKDKEKHKHHFLSRPKLKLKDKDDHHHLQLSSASSNSKPLDPNAPQSLYSFAPSSPSGTGFGKSMSGLDLRHGGRALREKKKEEKEKEKAEKAAAAAPQDGAQRDADQVGGIGDAAASEILQSFGVQNMAPEDAWDFLKAKLLVLFEGEDIRISLEDLNKLVSIHVRRCVQNRMPSVILEDLRDLLHTGFSSINQSLLSISDDRLVPYLSQTWLFVFGTVLPFIQAVFLPLDLEFKGRGSIMNSREAGEFWGVMPNGRAMGDALDVRDIVLTTFRNIVILTRYDLLKATFSQLSLDKIDIAAADDEDARPNTALGALDPRFASFNSQSTTVLNSPDKNNTNGTPLRGRSTSNTSSNPELPFLQATHSNQSSPRRNQTQPQDQPQVSNQPETQRLPVPPSRDPSVLITETVGRMFQCISILASLHSDDDAQQQIQNLGRAIKLNWLGRARTGRDRRGFVGTKVRRAQPLSGLMNDEEGKRRMGVVGGDRSD